MHGFKRNYRFYVGLTAIINSTKEGVFKILVFSDFIFL